ncbi:hypothetical protein [Rhizobium redzepovicii]|uniref:hypothetical protein n=1 Tax=Rhizobium redzepovicii TaxID=2867518 RepID=UPI002871E4AA|nr:hypothetical protein [Rhizobium redzepovicii]MDR9782116.1 hypothetical protein [Rhizobium redzepovicii]
MSYFRSLKLSEVAAIAISLLALLLSGLTTWYQLLRTDAHFAIAINRHFIHTDEDESAFVGEYEIGILNLGNTPVYVQSISQVAVKLSQQQYNEYNLRREALIERLKSLVGTLPDYELWSWADREFLKIVPPCQNKKTHEIEGDGSDVEGKEFSSTIIEPGKVEKSSFALESRFSDLQLGEKAFLLVCLKVQYVFGNGSGSVTGVPVKPAWIEKAANGKMNSLTSTQPALLSLFHIQGS